MAPDTRMPEPPSPVTAKTVVRTDFLQTRRGFDPDEVSAHLGRVAEHVADLESTIAELRNRLRERESAPPKDELARNEAYQTTAARIADLMRTFDQDMERLRAQAEAETDARLSEARANAERIDAETEKIRAEAEAEATRVVREATEEAARIRAEAERSSNEALSGLETRRRLIVDNIRRIRAGLGQTADALDELLGASEEDTIYVDGPNVRSPDRAPDRI
jgi:DivIVA domain-containing protein